MELSGRAVALYGRFSPGARDRLRHEIQRRGGTVGRDLTRRSDLLVVGDLAASMIDSGALAKRLAAAAARGVAVSGERRFAADIDGGGLAQTATLPLTSALSQSGLAGGDAALLAAFDVILIVDDHCRFGDAGVLRTAAELLQRGRSRGDAVRILQRARDLAPVGRRKIVLAPSGEAALQWQDGLTTLEGQGLLAFDESHASVEDLFEAAAMAEAGGDLDEAARLYDQCGRADRGDATAPYNYANIRLAQGAHDVAVLAYQRALARDPGFVEARYNLAEALEAAGKPETAAKELVQVLGADPGHADAVFNLARLRMKEGRMADAKTLYERYLALDPPEEWAATARKAIIVCMAADRR